MFARQYFPARYFTPRYWPPIGSSGPLAPTLEAAVRERLVASVTSLTGVYLAVTPARALMPFAIVSPLRFSMPSVTNEASYYEITPLQVTVFSDDDIAADQLGRACMRSLRAGPRLRFDDGYHMSGWHGGIRKWPAAQVGPAGQLAFRFEFDWVFQVGRDME
jgi:hypothetical protein